MIVLDCAGMNDLGSSYYFGYLYVNHQNGLHFDSLIVFAHALVDSFHSLFVLNPSACFRASLIVPGSLWKSQLPSSHRSWFLVLVLV